MVLMISVYKLQRCLFYNYAYTSYAGPKKTARKVKLKTNYNE